MCRSNCSQFHRRRQSQFLSIPVCDRPGSFISVNWNDFQCLKISKLFASIDTSSGSIYLHSIFVFQSSYQIDEEMLRTWTYTRGHCISRVFSSQFCDSSLLQLYNELLDHHKVHTFCLYFILSLSIFAKHSGCALIGMPGPWPWPCPSP